MSNIGDQQQLPKKASRGLDLRLVICFGVQVTH